MNERIKQLAEQAGLSEGRFERYKGQDCDLKGYSMLPEQMAKFAELLVQECCDIFVELRTRPADLAVKDVKKHFGVE